MRKIHVVLLLALLAAVLGLFACNRNVQARPGTRIKGGQHMSQNKTATLSLDLLPGQAADAIATTNPVAQTAPLSAEDTKQLLQRLPAPEQVVGLQKDFAKRPETLPAPRTGATVNVPFPSSDDLKPPTPPEEKGIDPGKLSVVRFAPQDEVPLAPEVTITFSHPMVALDSQTGAAQNVPVKIDPQPAGSWRWMGTKTIVFEAKDKRLPMATEYKVTVPKGTKSINGLTLDRDFTFEFATPALTLKATYPNDTSVKLNPLALLVFDQAIDAQKLLPFVCFKTVKGPNIAFHQVPEAEYQKDSQIVAKIGDTPKNRVIVLAPDQDLKKDTQYFIGVNSGAPSAEGPRTTNAQDRMFKTYGPFNLRDSRCGWGKDDPPPGTPWELTFTNNIDDDTFDPSAQIYVEPELEHMSVSCHGRSISIKGNSKGKTTYKVTIDKSLTDIFGQTLDSDATVKFTMGSASPGLQTVGGQVVVLDPKGPRNYSLYTINEPKLDVTINAVQAEDYASFEAWRSEQLDWRVRAKREKPKFKMPGRTVFSQTIKPEKVKDTFVETRIDLSPALNKSGLGHAIVVIRNKRDRSEEETVVVTWVQATEIGLSAYADSKTIKAWATDLATGKPLTDAEINGVKADAQGIVKFPNKDLRRYIIAKRGEDSAFLPDTSNLRVQGEVNRYKWHVFSDRGIYKPKEKASFKGWLREMTTGSDGDIVPVSAKVGSVQWTVSDSRNNDFARGTSPLSPYGGFDLEITIPDNINLGDAKLTVAVLDENGKVNRWSRNNSSTVLNFEIQEFRTPEFEVQAKNEQSVNILGEDCKVSAVAQYYAGGKLPNAKTNWHVSAHSSSYTPPKWDKFIFGTWRPWWNCFWFPAETSESIDKSLITATDSAGKSTLKLVAASSNEADRAPLPPMYISASAAVSDLNQQTWSSSTSLLLHPSELYVGLKPVRQFVEKGSPINLDYIVTDIDGKAQSNASVKLRSARITSSYRHGKMIETEDDIKEQTLKSGVEPQQAVITPKEGGHYRIYAEVTDSKGRRNRTQLVIWVAGGPQIKSRSVESEQVELVPDKKEYKVGDTAEILVVAPFAPAEGIYTLNRSGILQSERFTMNDTSYTIKVPITEKLIPNLHLQVNLVGKQPRLNDDGTTNDYLKPRPAYASGHLNISVPPYERTLSLQVIPRETKLAPGSNTAVDIVLKDSNGQPVTDSEVAVIAVDEAVLALIGYKIPNPIPNIYTSRSNEFASRDLRALVQLADPAKLEAAQAERKRSYDDDDTMVLCESAMVNGAMGKGAPLMAMKMSAPVMSMAAVDAPDSAPANAKPQPAIALRSNFDPQALWMATAHTDANGRAHLAYRLPDNLTRYRLTAVAADKNHKFGYGESTLTACLPLMVRPSLPRFLNFGDSAEMPVLVQNQTDKPQTVNIAMRAQNLTIKEPAGMSFTIPANDRREVRFPAQTQEAGEAKVQVAISCGDFSDAADVTIPIWTPCTSEAFATYGQIDKGAIKQPVNYPKDVWPQFGQLEITTSSTAVQELTDAYISLCTYPYDCSEQIASRMMTSLALKDVLTAFKASGMPSQEDLKKLLDSDIDRLLKRQESNGGFRTWDNSSKIYPYVSLHACRALLYAQKFGYGQSNKVTKATNKALNYVRNVDRYIDTQDYSRDSRRFLQAYAVDILREANQADVVKALNIINDGGLNTLSLDAIGFLYPTLSDEAKNNTATAKTQVDDIRKLLNNRVSETAGAACFTTTYSDEDYLLLSSSRRTDGILLRSIIIDQPKTDLIPKLVRGLLSHRKRGAWRNTQENAFILIALNDYFNKYESVTPNFVANIWLGNDYAGKHEFKGRTTEYQQTDVPMRYLEAHPKTDLVMAKEGEGRLYYRLGLKYAPKSLNLDPMDCGFEVIRSYEGVDNPDDVKRLADGSWQIKLGSRVLCKTSMVARSRRYHVALINPLPAGLEALNPKLKVTEDLPEIKKQDTRKNDYRWYWWGPWYEHANMRDERVEAFATNLYSGVFSYDFIARATTPGTFIVPPAKAEEMYSPEVFGRSASDKVIVK